LGVFSVLSFGSPALAQKILVLALPVIAAVSCYRALRALPVGRIAGVVGAACYALSPVALWSLSNGRLPESVFLAGLPWLVTRLVQTFGPRRRGGRLRSIVGAGLGIAALASFLPGTLLVVPVVLAVAFVLPAGERLRGLARAGLAVALALVLALPVLVAVLTSHGFTLADPTGHPSFASALRLVIGSAPGAWRVACFRPVAAGPGLAFPVGP